MLPLPRFSFPNNRQKGDVHSCCTGRRHLFAVRGKPSGPGMKSSFFLTSIVPDFARIAHSFGACFLYPLVQFILVLIESVATKDIAPRKRGWGRFPAMLEDDSVGQVDDGVPIPGGGECIGRFKHPRWARDLIAVTEELDRGRAKGCPMASMLSVPVRLAQGVTD